MPMGEREDEGEEEEGGGGGGGMAYDDYYEEKKQQEKECEGDIECKLAAQPILNRLLVSPLPCLSFPVARHSCVNHLSITPFFSLCIYTYHIEWSTRLRRPKCWGLGNFCAQSDWETTR